MSEGRGRSLTRQEFDAVIRRAAELSGSGPDVEGSLSESELFRIASEVGLPESHVRRALAEVRSGVAEQGVLDRLFGPATVRAVREVPGRPAELARTLDEFLVATQLLQPLRRGPEVLQYRPAVDWASQIARAASFHSRKYYIASAKSVELHLSAISDDRTLVAIVVDPGTRGDNMAGAVFGGGAAGVAAGVGVGFVSAAVLPVAAAVGAAVALGATVTGAVTVASGAAHKKKLLEVQAELEGVLDRLEVGDSLEPPPPSWRRWVKRHFHGVARDLIKVEDDERA